MIQITRLLARQVRAGFRACLPKGGKQLRPMVALQAGRDGLYFRLYSPEIFAEFHLADDVYRLEDLVVPLEAFAGCEGKDTSPVCFEAAGTTAIRCSWRDGGVPQVKEYDGKDLSDLGKFPALPDKLANANDGMLKAFADAAKCASQDAVRYATDHIMLRGESGEIIGTDGRQLLIQSGYRFPFDATLLIPGTGLFSRFFKDDEQVKIGATEGYVTLQQGGWTFHLLVNKDGRFPPVDDVIPKHGPAVTRCQLDTEDAVFLARALPRLPGDDTQDAPVTMDLDGQPMIRALAFSKEQPTELFLARSTVTGKAVRFSTNRMFLARALELGFTMFSVDKADTPVVCQDGKRKFLWMTLGGSGAIPASKECVRISSLVGSEQAPAKKPAEQAAPSSNGIARKSTPETDTTASGTLRVVSSKPERKTATKPTNPSKGSLMEEVNALRGVLRDAYTRTNALMALVKKQRQQAKLVESTIASLRQLKTVSA